MDPQPNEHVKSQQQFRLFEESLPKVSIVGYQMLINELVPLCIRVEKDLRGSDNSKRKSMSVNCGNEDELTGCMKNLEITGKQFEAAHKLIQQFQDADSATHSCVYLRLSQIGYQIGVKLTELLIFSNNPSLNSDSMSFLAVVKFICRDVWLQLYAKQINNLKTNHRGTFYLFDYEYQPIQQFSLEGELSQKELKLMEPYLEMPCGVIRGVLASFGFKDDQVSVSVSFVDLPSDKKVVSGKFPKGVNFNVQMLTK